MNRALAIAAAVAAGCAHAPPPPPRDPPPTIERDLRAAAARYLQCPAVELARDQWQGDRGSWHADGCGWEVTYLVACDAQGRCAFERAGDATTRY